MSFGAGVAVGGIEVAVGAGGWVGAVVGAGVAAGAQAPNTSEAIISMNRVTKGKRFIFISIYLLYIYCLCNL
jgi:hypothetical protein